MNIKPLAFATVVILTTTQTFSAALDRSGQSISAFLQPGNYAEIGISALDPDVSGKDNAGNSLADVGDFYHSLSAAIKIQQTEKLSLGLLFDQPYGAKSSYGGVNTFTNTLSSGVQNSSKAKVETYNFTGLLGYQVLPNLTAFGGLSYQQIEGGVDLRGVSYGYLNGYSNQMKKDGAVGWISGLAYEIPDIALKTSLTYHSKVNHKLDAHEKNPLFTALPSSLDSQVKVTTPDSINLDFQIGVIKDTVAFANLRWVNWSSFYIQPTLFGSIAASLYPDTNGFNFLDYSNDQWSANVGIGRKINEKLSGSVSVGWDSGNGVPIGTLGPTDGYWSAGIGMRYMLTPKIDLSGGFKYLWLGDANGTVAERFEVSEFRNNHAIGFGIKVGYHF
ncbi:OmpP1/FadL family transporter [Acinetobacter guillouiae]|uniref:OmpP1/FadL family transporter n=1 Tax=Acinetobacter guillouiae TaxID=106649 RepID=UPI002FD9F37C